MAELALGLWIVTALLGVYLFTFTTDVGRSNGAATSRLPPLALFVHPVLGLTGIGVWIGHLETGSALAAWLGVAGLLTGGAVGAVLGLRTESPRRGDARRPEGHGARVGVAEQRMPRPAIALHGLTASATLALALTVALGS